jgi:DNA modification methylase
LKPYHQDESVTLYQGDATAVSRELPDGSVDCIVTSPPYFGLRDYGVEGQYGLEASPADYVEKMRGLFSELRRVLACDGTLWLNIGDSYIKKHLAGVPWSVALALKEDGWVLRNAVIWSKTNAMPEGTAYDRLSNRYEHLFMFTKSVRYWFNLDAIREPHLTADRPLVELPSKGSGKWVSGSGTNNRDSSHAGVGRHPNGRNPGDVWKMATGRFKEAHFATFPPELPRRCIVSGCKPGGVVLDPFSGSGTTGMAALESDRKYVGIELNSEYIDLSLRTRLANRFLQRVTYDVS